MRYIEPDSMDATFHFAAEEYCMKQAEAWGPVLMIWRTNPCVMLGHYQLLEAEINQKVAREKGIQIVRRSTGGGTIFTDPGTLLYSFIGPCPMLDNGKADSAMDFKKVSQPILKALARLGIPAYLEGRNDLLLDGRKISGLAQRLSEGVLCSHGSLLYDADLSLLTQVLQVDLAKIQSKCISSVRSRVTNMKESLGLEQTVEKFWQQLTQALRHNETLTPYQFTKEDLKAIEVIRLRKYANPQWIYGSRQSFNYKNETRYPAGKVTVQLAVSEEKKIQQVKISGDFLGLQPLSYLEDSLCGLPYQEETVKEALSVLEIAPFLGGITKEQLLECLFS